MPPRPYCGGPGPPPPHIPPSPRRCQWLGVPQCFGSNPLSYRAPVLPPTLLGKPGTPPLPTPEPCPCRGSRGVPPEAVVGVEVAPPPGAVQLIGALGRQRHGQDVRHAAVLLGNALHVPALLLEAWGGGGGGRWHTLGLGDTTPRGSPPPQRTGGRFGVAVPSMEMRISSAWPGPISQGQCTLSLKTPRSSVGGRGGRGGR